LYDNVPVTRTHWLAIAVALVVALIWFAVGWPQQQAERVVDPGSEQASPSPPQPAVHDVPPTSAAPEARRAVEPTEPAATPGSETARTPDEPATNTTPRSNIRSPERTGPVDELTRLFASEPRSSGAANVEALIEAPFRRPEIPAGLLKSASCRSTVCKVETRWSPEGAQGFLSAVMRLVASPDGQPAAFDHNLAISPEGEASPDGSRAINVFLKRVAAAAPVGEAPSH
jgi:hypothetical protein